MRRPWWERLELITLTTAAPWDPPKGHRHRVYTDGTHSFHEDEIAGNFDQAEEQLWAYRNGLSDIGFTIEVSVPRIRNSRTAKRS